MFWNEFETLIQVLHLFGTKEMAIRAQDFITIKAAEYGSFWKSSSKLKMLGKLATPIDVTLRVKTVINEKEENRSGLYFEKLRHLYLRVSQMQPRCGLELYFKKIKGLRRYQFLDNIGEE